MTIQKIEGAPQPLEGVRVVELANFMTAPQGTEILAMMGAEVIKIETPSGDGSRFAGASRAGVPLEGDKKNPWFEGINFNKEFMCLNFRTDEGKEAMVKLLGTADLFVTNYRLSALQNMGLDYPTLHEIYPHLPMVHVTGYGECGPDVNAPGYDQATFFARPGFLNNITPYGAEEPPAVSGMVMGDTITGMTTAIGSMIVLYESKMKGYGDYCTLGLLSSSLYLQRWLFTDWQYGLELPQRFAPLPCNDFFRSKDGLWVALGITTIDPIFNQLMTILGREDLCDDPVFSISAEVARQHKHAEFRQILRDAFAQFDAEDIVSRLKAAEIPAEVCRTFDDVLKDPQVIENEFLHTIEYEDGDTYVVPNCLLRTRCGSPEFRLTKARGADNARYLSELGYDDDTIAKWAEQGIAPVIPTPDYSKQA